MAGVDVTKRSYGIVFTCTSGTAAAVTLLPATERLRVTGIHFAGAATTDIITINDAAGSFVAVGFGGSVSNNNISFAEPISLDGIQVGIAGATTGKAVVYTK